MEAKNRAPDAVAKTRFELYMYSRSETAMLAVRLNEELEARLAALARRTGRTKTFYAREAIETHLDDLEDFYAAEDRMARYRAADAIPLETLKADLGLDD